MTVAAFLPKNAQSRLAGARKDVLRAVPRLHPEIGVQRVLGSLMATGPDNILHTFEDEQGLNEIAERIVELVDGRRTVADIVAVLCEEFAVGPEECREDTVAFVSLLVEKKVLVLGS